MERMTAAHRAAMHSPSLTVTETNPMTTHRAGTFNVTAHERIVFGTPAADAVLAAAERIGAERVFVTSTRSLAQKEAGPLQRIEKALGSKHAGTFATIRSHSPREDVVAGAAQARAANADLLVAVGGGSVIDATKVMQLCLWAGLDSPEALEPYCSGFDRSKVPKLALPADPVRMVAVSTTLSASEFTDGAGITESSTNTKQSFRHRLFAPRTVILDPEATLDTPDWLLFATGIRAVDHAVENYCNARANPATEALSLQGLRLLSRALPAIKKNPRDLGAGSRRSSACGRRLRLRPPACRPAPVTASAMRSVRPSASRTATPPA